MNNLKIIVADTAGFCFGVNNAVNLVYKLVKDVNRKLYTFGPVIHNKQVVEELMMMNVMPIDDIEKLEDGSTEEGSTIVIRAHGVGPKVYESLNKKKISIVDATCPYVKKIHILVKEKYEQNYQIVIVGDESHPEVIGINGWCDDTAIIVNEKEDVNIINNKKKIAVFAQTTITFSKWDEINKFLLEKFNYVEKFDTICSATSHRQMEAAEMSKVVDLMLVIGSKISSNTHKLYEVCKENCKNAIKIETVSELSKINLYNIKKIGITAGASTPHKVIKEVIDKMSEINKPEMEKNFSDMVEESLKTIWSGEIVTGRIINYNETEVYVDLGFKSDGIVPMEEFTENLDFDKSQLQPGKEIEVYVVNVNDGEGNVKLSRRKVESMKMWENIGQYFQDKETINAKVTETVNKGIIATKNGVKIFIPASQVGNKRIKDLNEYLNKVINFRIIEFDKNKKKVIGSEKVILEEERKSKAESFWNEIEKGKVYTGKVKSLTNFGAFVDIGGIDGLIHISELSWSRIKHPSEVLNIDDDVEVSILDFNKETKKISLGYRKSSDNPWDRIDEKFPIGTITSGKVVRMVPFGVFIDLGNGVDGLVHISQISTKRLAKPDDVLAIGQVVDVKVLDVNVEKQKISLSIKEVKPIDKEDDADDVTEPVKSVKREVKEKEIEPKEHIENATNTIGEMLGKKFGKDK